MDEKHREITDVEHGEKDGQHRRSSLTANDIRHGDVALNLIGDERVELTDEDVCCSLCPSLPRQNCIESEPLIDDPARTNGFAARQTE